MECVRIRLGFENGIDVRADGSKGDLCLSWKLGIEVSLKSFSLSHIDVDL